jgi:hypothetical protein
MLKKAQVDGHAHKCRRCHSVSCVDCNVSFYGGKKYDVTRAIRSASKKRGTGWHNVDTTLRTKMHSFCYHTRSRSVVGLVMTRNQISTVFEQYGSDQNVLIKL